MHLPLLPRSRTTVLILRGDRLDLFGSPFRGGTKWRFGWPAFVMGCSGRLRGWGSCGSGCVVRLFLDNSTACFSVSVSVLACCGSAWFFFEWTFLSCPGFFWMGSGLFSCFCCRVGFVRGSGPVVFYGEFDPGSGRTLAACLTHASRTVRRFRAYTSGERVSNT